MARLAPDVNRLLTPLALACRLAANVIPPRRGCDRQRGGPWCRHLRSVASPTSRRSPAAAAGRVGAIRAWLAAICRRISSGRSGRRAHHVWKRIQEKGLYERLWEATRLYENEDNPVIQAFSIIGRYHGQYWSVDADQGSADGWENRRFYAGAEAVLFHNFTVQAQIKISEDFDPFYDGLYQAFVKWSPGEAFSLAAGRMDFLSPASNGRFPPQRSRPLSAVCS